MTGLDWDAYMAESRRPSKATPVRRLWEFALDALFVLGFYGGIAAALLAAVVGGVVSYSSHSCEVRADKMHLEGEWTYWGDCRVLVNDRWLDIDSYRVMVEEGK